MIHIACNIDSNFTIHCAVTLTSLFANNRNSEFCVHIIASTLPEADQKALSSIAESYGNKICFYFPEKDLLNNFPSRKVETEFRLQHTIVVSYPGYYL